MLAQRSSTRIGACLLGGESRDKGWYLPRIMAPDYTLAFLVTLIAGLATSVGSLIAFTTRHTNRIFFSVALGFSAGAMIFASFMQILPSALSEVAGSAGGSWWVLAAFIGGALVIAVIDRTVPDFGNPHENLEVEVLASSEQKSAYRKQPQLMRAGVFVAITIALHNFPEGMAAFFVTLSEPAVGIALGVAIAIHNIPEGIAVSVPVYFATGSRMKALLYSSLSGLAEPLGAVIAFLILGPFLSPLLLGLVLAAVAGVMVFISLDQMLPVARDYGHPHLVVYGVLGGMVVMGASLILLRG